MALYTRVSEGVEIEWSPEYEDIGSDAVRDVTGDEPPVEVNDDDAEEIRERYSELIDEE